MKLNKSLITFVITIFAVSLLFLFFQLTSPVLAHSGRTDSSGGHNCNVGACAGTYHYHNGGSAPAPQTYTAPVQPYVAPVVQETVPTVIPTKIPTRIPTRMPTKTPTPSITPTETTTPTMEPTKTPIPVKAVKITATKPGGFWGFILSLFGR